MSKLVCNFYNPVKPADKVSLVVSLGICGDCFFRRKNSGDVIAKCIFCPGLTAKALRPRRTGPRKPPVRTAASRGEFNVEINSGHNHLGPCRLSRPSYEPVYNRLWLHGPGGVKLGKVTGIEQFAIGVQHQ
jgi:hypothetical protein